MPQTGALSDWTTQQWVMLTGQRIALAAYPWLEGPVAGPEGVGLRFFHRLAESRGLVVRSAGPSRGLLPSLDLLAGPWFDPRRLDPDVRAFYERTSDFELDAWAEWCGAFRPLGRLLALIFSRRLQQLNVPLEPLDTALGTTSEVLQLADPDTGRVALTAWVRQLRRTGNVLYAGSYSICTVPGHTGPCVKVVFPLPTGNGIVILRPSVDETGALTVTSAGRHFGDPGFYFTVHRPEGRMWARYVRAMTESIRVYSAGAGEVRADHTMWFAGLTFMRLHYRLRPRSGAVRPASLQSAG